MELKCYGLVAIVACYGSRLHMFLHLTLQHVNCHPLWLRAATWRGAQHRKSFICGRHIFESHEKKVCTILYDLRVIVAVVMIYQLDIRTMH